jgi:periplasmic copper chaperone A
MTLRISPFGALVLGGLMALPQVEVSAASRELEADDGWSRATAPGQTVAAGYLELRNSTQRADALIAASTPAAASVELHTASLQNGIMRMRRLDRLALPAGRTVTLAPGGHHLMLIGLRQRLVPGQSISVTLQFASGRSITTRLAVRDSNANRHEDHRHHEHD